MKQVTPELLEHLHTGKEFHMVDLYEITLKSGLVFRYANYDRDIKLPDGRIFSHKGPLFKRTRIKLSSGISVDKMTVTVHTDESDTIDGTPMMQIAHNGGFDEAQLSLHRCFLKELEAQEIVRSEATFTRASTAYKRDGSEVASGLPRYETLYGDQVLVEETTNLITKQNMTETPWTKGPNTIVEYGIVLDGETWNRFSVPASTGTFVQFPFSAFNGRPYTISMTCRNPFSEPQTMQIGFSEAAGAGATLGRKDINIPPNSTIKLETSFIAQSDMTYYATIDNVSNANLVDVLLKDIQLEAKPYATPFTIGYRPEQRNELPFGKGIVVEEGTTNLIPVDKQKFEGWSARSGAVVNLTQNQSVPEWGAVDATRIQTSGGSQTYKYTYDIVDPSTEGASYTFSVWIKNIGSATVGVSFYPEPNVISILPGESKRVSVSRVGDGVSVAQIRLRALNVSDSLDFIAWRPMAEEKAYSTSWHPTTRQPEVVTIKHGLTPEEGTIEGIFEVNELSLRSGFHRVFHINRSGGYGIVLRRSTTNWQLAIWADDNSATSAVRNIVMSGFVRYRVTWLKSGGWAKAEFFSVNTKQKFGEIVLENVNFPSVLVNTLYVGSYLTDVGVCSNTIHADIRCSSIARTDTEYGLDAPLPVDEYTTAKVGFNDLTVQRMVLHNALERSSLQVVGAVEMFTGYIDVDGGGGLEMKWVVKSGAQKLNVEYPLRKYYPTCPYSLYGPGCGLDLEEYTTTGTVTAVESYQEFQTNLNAVDGYYEQGGIEWLTGPLAGVSAPIQTSYQANGRIIMLIPLDAAPQVGDTFKIYPGCNKTPITCKNKFNNFNKNRATPYIPLKETII